MTSSVIVDLSKNLHWSWDGLDTFVDKHTSSFRTLVVASLSLYFLVHTYINPSQVSTSCFILFIRPNAFVAGAKEEWNEEKREKRMERSMVTTLHLQPKCKGQPAQERRNQTAVWSQAWQHATKLHHLLWQLFDAFAVDAEPGVVNDHPGPAVELVLDSHRGESEVSVGQGT
jgi:hypothetical protein